jgi:hypothetical protein
MKRLTKQEFIERCKIVHGNKYDYSLVNYKNCMSKVKIICPEHDEIKDNYCKDNNINKI